MGRISRRATAQRCAPQGPMIFRPPGELGMLGEHKRVEAEIIEAVKRLEARYHGDQSPLALTGTGAAAQRFRVPSVEPRGMKYVRSVGGHVRKWRVFTPYLGGLQKAFEIGVGPGYLFRLMIELYGTDMRGCDLDPAKNPVFRDLRKELGLSERVMTHKVIANNDIPIPEGSEAVMGFWTVFTETFSLDDHKWFVAQCREKLVGPKKLVMLFNTRGYDERPEIFDWYKTFAAFPLLNEEAEVEADIGDGQRKQVKPRDRRAFCVAEL